MTRFVITLAVASAALIVSCVSSLALETTTYKAESANSADAEWKKIGNFCGIASWHPGVGKCELSEDNKVRTLALKGGGTIVERLLKWDDEDRSYTYTMLSGPLPVKDYVATIKVVPEGSASQIIWTSTYEPRGIWGHVTAAAVEREMYNIYKNGADSLAR